MKKLMLGLAVLLMPAISKAFAPSIAVVVKDGSLQAGTTTGFNVSSGTVVNFNSTNANIQNLNVATITSTGTNNSFIGSTITVGNLFISSNTTIIGTGPITGSTCAASTAVGGGLTVGVTYYWKVYAIPAIGNGSVGSQTGLTSMTMVANASQRAGRLSWNAATGANHYAITRHTGLTGPDGLLISTITNTVFLDTGAALSAANPWPSTPYGSTGAYFSSGILMNANMPIVWNDYVTGSPLAYIGPTSAGEWVIKGGLGVNKNNVYFANSSDQNYWRFLQDSNDSSSVLDAVVPGSNNDNHMKVISGSSTTFVVSNVDVVDISTTGINVHPTNNGNGITFANPANNQTAVIRNNGGSTVANIDLVHNGSPSAVTVRTSGTGNVEFAVTDSSITETLPAFFGSSVTVTSTVTISNNLLLTGEFRPGLTSGTTGQILVAQAAGFAPKFQWAGELIQVATQTTITSSATTSATYGNTNLSASITPKSTNSLIKITVSGPVEDSLLNQSGLFTITRGSTNIASGGGNNAIQQVFSAGGDTVYPLNMVTTDKPQTTSSVTYTLQFRVGGGATCTFGSSQVQSIMILEEIGQ